jgi:hypothetical protein
MDYEAKITGVRETTVMVPGRTFPTLSNPTGFVMVEVPATAYDLDVPTLSDGDSFTVTTTHTID